MTIEVAYRSNRASETQIFEHLSRCDGDFVPPLSGRLSISDYAKKIVSKAIRFEAWADSTLVGLVAAYCNDQQRCIAYITSVSVLKAWTGEGIAAQLMRHCIAHSRTSGMQQISLEVASNNTHAIKLYEKCGFVTVNAKASLATMYLLLNSEKNHEQQT